MKVKRQSGVRITSGVNIMIKQNDLKCFLSQRILTLIIMKCSTNSTCNTPVNNTEMHNKKKFLGILTKCAPFTGILVGTDFRNFGAPYEKTLCMVLRSSTVIDEDHLSHPGEGVCIGPYTLCI